jgi:Flp pilus assembly secretin CpaC
LQEDLRPRGRCGIAQGEDVVAQRFFGNVSPPLWEVSVAFLTDEEPPWCGEVARPPEVKLEPHILQASRSVLQELGSEGDVPGTAGSDSYE